MYEPAYRDQPLLVPIKSSQETSPFTLEVGRIYVTRAGVLIKITQVIESKVTWGVENGQRVRVVEPRFEGKTVHSGRTFAFNKRGRYISDRVQSPHDVIREATDDEHAGVLVTKIGSRSLHVLEGFASVQETWVSPYTLRTTVNDLFKTTYDGTAIFAALEKLLHDGCAKIDREVCRKHRGRKSPELWSLTDLGHAVLNTRKEQNNA